MFFFKSFNNIVKRWKVTYNKSIYFLAIHLGSVTYYSLGQWILIFGKYLLGCNVVLGYNIVGIVTW